MPKAPRPPAALQTIDPTALAQVGGGAARSSSSDSGSGDADTALLTALTGIVDSLKELSSGRSSGGGFNSQDLMLMMMVMQRNRQQPVAVIPTNTGPFPPVIF